MGLCPRPRTVFESVGESRYGGAGLLLSLGIRSYRCLHVSMLAQAFDAADFRLSRNSDGTVPAAAHSLRACGGAMARRRGQFSDLGYPVTKMLAHTLARAVDAADFRRSRNGDGAEAAGVHSLRACRGAIVRRRRLNAYLAFPVAPTYVGATVEKRRWAAQLSSRNLEENADCRGLS